MQTTWEPGLLGSVGIPAQSASAVQLRAWGTQVQVRKPVEQGGLQTPPGQDPQASMKSSTTPSQSLSRQSQVSGSGSICCPGGLVTQAALSNEPLVQVWMPARHSPSSRPHSWVSRCTQRPFWQMVPGMARQLLLVVQVVL